MCDWLVLEKSFIVGIKFFSIMYVYRKGFLFVLYFYNMFYSVCWLWMWYICEWVFKKIWLYVFGVFLGFFILYNRVWILVRVFFVLFSFFYKVIIFFLIFILSFNEGMLLFLFRFWGELVLLVLMDWVKLLKLFLYL